MVTIGFVCWSEGAPEGGFFVDHDEEMAGEEERRTVREQGGRPEEQRSAGEGQGGADVHRIADEPVRAADYQTPGRVKGGGSAFADPYEGEDAPEGDGRAEGTHDHAGDLRRFDHRWTAQT